MKNLKEIQAFISEFGQKLTERKMPKGLFVVLGERNEFAEPFIEIKSGYYQYVVMERGQEITRRKTQDLDELLYWLISNDISKIASNWELRHRKEGKDCRRLIFAKEVELFKKINSTILSIYLKWSDLLFNIGYPKIKHPPIFLLHLQICLHHQILRHEVGLRRAGGIRA